MIPTLILNKFLQPDLFGISLFDLSALLELILRFSFDLFVTLIIVRVIYYAKNKRKDYLFTYILIGLTVFLLCTLLGSVNLKVGFALGLFAIFGIIRYRTNSMPIKEMTYLFLIIGISVLNALSDKTISFSEIIFVNFILIAATWMLEHVFLLENEASKTIIYEKIELIKPENNVALIKDLEERTGLHINRIEIGEINFLRDTAIVRIFYFEKKSTINISSEINSHFSDSDDDDD